MTEEEKILRAWDEHFQKLSLEEIEKDIEIINSIGPVGVSYEDYLHILNTVTSLTLTETGLCDDIAFADFFNRSIMDVQMDNSHSFTLIEITGTDNKFTSESICVIAGESNYAMAA